MAWKHETKPGSFTPYSYRLDITGTPYRLHRPSLPAKSPWPSSTSVTFAYPLALRAFLEAHAEDRLAQAPISHSSLVKSSKIQPNLTVVTKQRL